MTPREPTQPAAEWRQQIVNRIRQRVQVQLDPDESLSPYAPDHDIHDDKQILHDTFNLHGSGVPSSRGGRVGTAVTRLRREIVGLLHPTLDRQTQYNAAATRLTTYLLEQFESESHLIRMLEGQVERAVTAVDRLEGQVAQLSAAGASADRELDRARLADALGTDGDAAKAALAPAVERLRAATGPVLVLRCGSGDLLELLNAAGTESYGVEDDLGMIARCHAKGLRVERVEAARHLESVPAHSLGAIFAGGLLESLSVARILTLVRLSRRALRPGGVLVLRGTDPVDAPSVAALLEDPAAIRPYGPIGLAALLEQERYGEVEVRRGDGAYLVAGTSPR